MLFDKLKQDISFLEKRITIQERSVSNWKYATDEFYTLIPFEKELNKMKLMYEDGHVELYTKQ